jgi:hypothetical protein
MEVIYLPIAKEHLEYWINTGNKLIIKRIRMLQEDIIKNQTFFYLTFAKLDAQKRINQFLLKVMTISGIYINFIF